MQNPPAEREADGEAQRCRRILADRRAPEVERNRAVATLYRLRYGQ
jgi:hypothetical protein